jgi:hypothetical protein
MKILSVNKRIADVFWGNQGWKTHTRIRITGPNTFDYISGNKMPRAVQASVADLLGK